MQLSIPKLRIGECITKTCNCGVNWQILPHISSQLILFPSITYDEYKEYIRPVPTLIFLLTFTACYSNDGAFRAAGNQLIPIYETDISVKKEILTINRISSGKAAITVYYQPYITRFTVNMNGEAIPFKVAIVNDSLYYNKGNFKSIPTAQINKEIDENDLVNFFYVYHFKALFKPGVNIVTHTYTVDLSSSVYENYALQYILTAAGRWANRQIDDFTLQINMGEFQHLSIQNTFFSSPSQWQLPATAKGIFIKKKDKNENDKSEFFVRKGMLVFQKQNFKPIGELFIHSFIYDFYNGPEVYDGLFNYNREGLPFSIEDQDCIQKPANEFSKRVLKNLPFARRGYVFKSPELQAWFEKQPWYKKDEKYLPVLAELTQKEQAWLSRL